MGFSENGAAQGYSAERAITEDALAWAGFTAARAASEFCQSWLNLQCRLVANTVTGLLLLEEDDGSFAPAATWPADTNNVSDLVPAAERALRERRGIVERTDAGHAHVGYPVDIRGKLWGVVVVDVGNCPEAALQQTLRQLHWGAGWVETLFHRRQAEQDAQSLATARLALEMAAFISGANGSVGAATALASELAKRLDCRRVAIGAVRHGRARVVALSYAASVSKELRLADSLANTMEEAVDQAASIGYPPFPNSERRIAVAHADHVRGMHLTSVLSVVLRSRGQIAGVITLERDVPVPFDTPTVILCEAVAALAGPILGLQRDLDRPLTGRIPRWLGTGHRAVFGRRHPTVKLVLGVAGVVAVWLSVATGDFRLTGKATIEGSVQQALVAPFDGFIATAPLRAGDVVAPGDILATLDSRELELQALRFESQRDEARLKQATAEGKHDQAEAAVQNAYSGEADAQWELAHSKLDRARISAPFRGLVVSGDLTQELGSPVERGKVLFEIAPLDSYRVVVEVDEHDIAYVRTGQVGHLVLNGLTADDLDFDVVRIVPVAVAADGHNSFRVEGTLRMSDPRLRPGMEGVGKIVAGRARLVWLWVHPITDWARLLLWKWWP